MLSNDFHHRLFWFMINPLEILLWWKVGIIHHSRAEFLEEQTTKDTPSIHHLRDRGDIIVTNPLIIFQVIRDLLTKRKPLLVFDLWSHSVILNASWECDNLLCSTTLSPKITSKIIIRISLQLMTFFLRKVLNLLKDRIRG